MANKFYAIRKGRKTGIYTDWATAEALVKGVASEYKSFKTKDEAVRYLLDGGISVENEIVSAADSDMKQTFLHYIGADEVGKVEPLRRTIAVAAYISPEHLDDIREMGADRDSKEYSIDSDEITSMGQKFTPFFVYEECKNGVYTCEEYGVTFSVYGISNKTYNDWHENPSIKANANKIVSVMHNRACMALYENLIEQGIDAEAIVIDNYMGEFSYNFDKKYVVGETKTITKDSKAKVVFEEKAENKYPAVAVASIIGSYIEHLWQEYVRAAIAAKGGDLEGHQFGNTNTDVDIAFEELKRLFGSLDAPEVDVKHTAHYERWKLSN